ncbi:MAG: hypothetical protein RLZZ505_3307 [Verrucomicrobiota bacterium]
MDSQTNNSRLQRWVIRPIANQLQQGTSPEKLSWSVSLGLTLGVFPIMGSTSLVCFIVGHLFRLNQPVLHLFKTFTYPIHLALILIYIRIGQHLNGVPPIPFSIPQLLTRFKESPAQFASDFGMAALHGIEAWAISAIFLIPLFYYISLPVLRKLLGKVKTEVWSG